MLTKFFPAGLLSVAAGKHLYCCDGQSLSVFNSLSLIYRSFRHHGFGDISLKYF